MSNKVNIISDRKKQVLELGIYDEVFIPDEMKTKLDAIKGMPFWIENPVIHKTRIKQFGRRCCFNHYIGEPIKNQRRHPIYDYEMRMFRLIFQDNKRRIYVKKSRGIGVTEFMLRVMAWLSLYSDNLKGMQMAIVTGPRQKTAEDILTRMKNLFAPRLGIDFSTLYNKNTLVLNGCRINAYPSRNISALRAQENMVFILVDEADFFPRNDQNNVRDAVEGYIGKNDSIIALVSTPNEPNGLFNKIENEPTQEQIDKFKMKNVKPCLYERLYYDYTYGEGKIYSETDIENARKSPSWLREFCLQYGYGTGTIFSNSSMETVKQLGAKFKSDYTKIDPYTPKAMSIDPGFGGQSGSAIIITELLGIGIIRTIYARRKMSMDYGELTDWTLELRRDFDPDKIYVDGWHAGFIRTLKKKVGERWRDDDVAALKERAKKYKQPIEKYMHIIPVMAQNRTREILTNTRDIIETEESFACDVEEFHELYIDIVSAKQEDGKLVKEGDDSKDLMDALMMNLLYYTSTNTVTPIA